MVSTRANPRAEPGRDCSYVGWGLGFHAQHSLAFPGFSGAALTVNVAWPGLLQILRYGGSGRCPARLLVEHEAVGRVHRVPQAPEIRQPA